MSDKYVVETCHYRSCLHGSFQELVSVIELCTFSEASKWLYNNFSTVPSESYNIANIKISLSLFKTKVSVSVMCFQVAVKY